MSFQKLKLCIELEHIESHFQSPFFINSDMVMMKILPLPLYKDEMITLSFGMAFGILTTYNCVFIHIDLIKSILI